MLSWQKLTNVYKSTGKLLLFFLISWCFNKLNNLINLENILTLVETVDKKNEENETSDRKRRQTFHVPNKWQLFAIELSLKHSYLEIVIV